MVIKPNYAYLKLTPANSIRNYNSDKIAESVQHLYKNLSQSMQMEGFKINYTQQPKVSYFIYMEKSKIEFYFIIPRDYLGLIREKISDTWKSITIKEVDSIPAFSVESTRYQLRYKKENPLSLAVDKRTNTLLSSMLNVVEVMEENDKLGVFYNFIPVYQGSWRAEYDRTMEKIKENKPIDNQKFSLGYVGKIVLVIFIEVLSVLTGAIEGLFNINEKQGNKMLLPLAITQDNKNELSSATRNKKEKTVLGTQILVMSESKNKVREKNNAISTCESFKSISDDNELTYKRIKTQKNSARFRKKQHNEVELLNTRITKVEVNKMSSLECQNLLSLPGRELLEMYNCIEKIDTFESTVPVELQSGIMCIGENKYKDQTVKAYLTEDKEFRNLTLVLVGPTRAGKTTLIANLSKDGIDNNETTILFDYCGNCDLSDEVKEVINPNKVLEIDCSDFDKMQGLGYNEVTPKSDNPLEVYRCAKTKTSQLMTLVNSIAGEELRDRMERYLETAAVTVFIQDGPIKDVFGVLQNHNLRRSYINSRPKNQDENLSEYVLALEELDEWSKATKDNPAEVIGTKSSFVQGILNRVSKLKQNTYMELMLKKDCSNNINLTNEIQKAQLICIRMPETMFSTETEKDIYATYWLTKIWGALQKRKWNLPDAKNRVKVNIVIDELYQVPSCQEFLRSKLSQIAKFTAKPIISCHYLGQIGIIRNELKAANSSYMLISGCDKDNFKELKSELYPYTEEDLLNLKRFQSLNLIKYEDGYAKFITQMPPQLLK